jgi:predicted dithiol-disulfide oxidoreductase (DUF899 family)
MIEDHPIVPHDAWTEARRKFLAKEKEFGRVADTAFHPSDDFCTVWRLFDLLPEGAADWRPKFVYQ